MCSNSKLNVIELFCLDRNCEIFSIPVVLTHLINKLTAGFTKELIS